MRKTSKVYEWIEKEERRKKILTILKQPLTARQISRKTGIPTDTCSYTIAKLVDKGLLICLNPNARIGKLYWFTESGRQCCKRVYRDLNLAYVEDSLAEIDWELYGWICFNHRSAVIKTMTETMQPSEIKRTLRNRDPNIKISANNIRDIVKLFLSRGIVRPVEIRKKAHPKYELTELGSQLKQLLIKAESRL